MWAWAGACGGDEATDDGPPPEETAVVASCAVVSDNALRIACAWPGGAAATLRLTGPDGVERSFEGAGGEVVGWGLTASTPYEVVLDGAAGELWRGRVATPILPSDVALTFEEVVAGPSSVEHLLFPLTCGGATHLYVTDAQGEVVWYSGTGLTGGVTGLDHTGDGVVILAGRRWVRELRWDGTIGVDAERDLAEGSIIHHSVDADGRVVVLDTRPREWPDGKVYLDDGVAVVRGDTVENVFRLGDVLDPQGRTSFLPEYWLGTFPGAIDAFHLNAVDLLPDGGFLLSAKHLDTVVRIRAAGPLGWALAGSPAAPPLGAAALTAVGPVESEFQHGVNVAPWGNVLLVDNGRYTSDTRVVELHVDEVARTAETVREWPLGVRCPVQSSAYGLQDGTVVAVCAQSYDWYELDDAGIRRQVRVGCENGQEPAMIPRLIPIAFP